MILLLLVLLLLTIIITISSTIVNIITTICSELGVWCACRASRFAIKGTVEPASILRVCARLEANVVQGHSVRRTPS